MQGTGFVVKNKSEVVDQDAIFADESFFTVFSFPFLYGDPKTALSEIRSVVLSEETAIKYFGKKDPVGQTLEMNTGNKFEPFTVTGVMKAVPRNSSIKPEMIVPMKFSQSQFDDDVWNNFFLNTFLLVKPGTDVKLLETKFNQIYLTEAAEQNKMMAEKYGMKDKTTYKLQPLLALHLSEDYPANNGLSDASKPIYSYILTAIALFVLLIACFNFINLTVARSLKRAKEIGVRKAIGSLRSQLMAQFLGESFVVCLVAFLCAVCLVNLLLPFFNAISERSLSFSYLLDSKLIIGFVFLFFLTGLLAGFYPAVVLSRFTPVETLYGKLRYSGKNYLSKGLVVLQFTLSIFLIIATVTIYRQFNYLMDFDLGYDDSNVLTVVTPPISNDKMSVLKNELGKNPSLGLISATQTGENVTLAHINGETDIKFSIKRIDENYLKLFKIPLTEGRNFSPGFPTDSTQAILINETFAKEAGWKNGVGKEVDFFYRKKKFKVIGIVKDYHFASLNETIMPELLHLSSDFNSFRKIMIKINPGNRSAALGFVANTFKKLYPETPYRYSFKDEDNKANYENEAKWKKIITFSAALTIFISCVGLFALAALSAEKRSKEIGIRKVFGASVAIIVKHLTVDFLKLVTFASVIACPLAWWLMSKWLQNYPYRIDLKLAVFGFIIGAVLMVAFLTICYQSVKAAMSNPIKNLRTE
jgi:putative ABC transport system permease protein